MIEKQSIIKIPYLHIIFFLGVFTASIRNFENFLCLIAEVYFILRHFTSAKKIRKYNEFSNLTLHKNQIGCYNVIFFQNLETTSLAITV